MNKDRLLILLPLLCLCSCGYWEGKHSETAPAEVKVRVVEAKVSGGDGTATYMGTVRSAKTAVLTAAAPGNLQQVKVRQGQKVRKGDVVAVLSSESVNSALEIASATLAQARDGYDRLLKVYEKGGVTEVKKMEVETQLRTAQASYAAASRAKTNCTLRAPFSGTVEEVIAHEGEELGLLAPVVRISDTEKPEIHFNVPENEVGTLAAGETVTVEIPALDKSLDLPVGLVNASGNLLSHTYDCAVYPGGQIDGLRPGMIVKVHRQRAAETDRLSIPAGAVFTGMDGRYVWVVEDGTVQKRTIVPCGYTEAGITVSEGLSEGELVIVEGARKVCSGMKVEAVR